jgi:REP element-mobilizing transposase RayT
LITEIQRVKQRDALRVFGFAIMSTHYHVALRTADVPLWKTMLLLQARFARGHNLRRSLLGPLWQSRYKARIVDGQSYFEQLLAYIHLNPVTAGIVDDPADYQWSGHRELLGLRRPVLVDVDETLSSFGTTRGEAREHYLNRVRLCGETKWLQMGIRSLPW